MLEYPASKTVRIAISNPAAVAFRRTAEPLTASLRTRLAQGATRGIAAVSTVVRRRVSGCQSYGDAHALNLLVGCGRPHLQPGKGFYNPAAPDKLENLVIACNVSARLLSAVYETSCLFIWLPHGFPSALPSLTISPGFLLGSSYNTTIDSHLHVGYLARFLHRTCDIARSL